MLRRRPASGRGGFARAGARARIVRSPLIASPLLFGAPVALGIAVSFVRLLGLRYPYLGWATTVNSDADELYLGHTLYQNPAHGYTGQIYTPLFPTIASLFDRLYLWNGWPLILVIGATVFWWRAKASLGQDIPRTLDLGFVTGALIIETGVLVALDGQWPIMPHTGPWWNVIATALVVAITGATRRQIAEAALERLRAK